MAQQATIENQQSMRIGVNGPDGANTLIITTGMATFGLQAFNNSVGGSPTSQQGSFFALLEPTLTQGQFRRALATGALAGVNYTAQDPAQRVSANWNLSSVEADLNDESGRVQLRFDASVTVGGQNSFGAIVRISFQVTTLAAL